MLIISNECLSTVTSNGRTLRNFLDGWPREKIAQFCIRGNAPDYSACDNYYYVSDRDALNAFLKGKRASGQMPRTTGGAAPAAGGAGGRNALTMLLRDLVWNSMRWAGKPFRRWLDGYAPELVLLQAGDCGFMYRLAESISKRYNAPLVIYNSEGYYFKRYDYFKAKGLAHWCYPVFRGLFCRQFRRTMNRAAFAIYICHKLQRDYDREFDIASAVVYTATALEPGRSETHGTGFTVSYLGNLGVGRHEPLTDIARTLQSISEDLRLDVYGRIPNETVRSAFEACPGIRCKGFVSYDEVGRVIRESDLIVHGENFSDFYREDLKYAFSTKFADSLAASKCFLLYAPKNMACTEYLLDNDAAWVATDRQELADILRRLYTQPEIRDRYRDNAAGLVRQNHCMETNVQTFRNILTTVWREGK